MVATTRKRYTWTVEKTYELLAEIEQPENRTVLFGAGPNEVHNFALSEACPADLDLPHRTHPETPRPPSFVA